MPIVVHGGVNLTFFDLLEASLLPKFDRVHIFDVSVEFKRIPFKLWHRQLHVLLAHVRLLVHFIIKATQNVLDGLSLRKAGQFTPNAGRRWFNLAIIKATFRFLLCTTLILKLTLRLGLPQLIFILRFWLLEF